MAMARNTGCINASKEDLMGFFSTHKLLSSRQKAASTLAQSWEPTWDKMKKAMLCSPAVFLPL